MVAGQRIHVGYGHAGLTVTIAVIGDRFHVYDGDVLLAQVVDTSTKPIARYKALKPEPPRPKASTR
jgi:hypothetical protein